jgi:N-acylneuraminate cytidylyltransferase
MYHDVGMFYFYRTQAFLSGRMMRTVPFVLNEESVQDIDTPEDWAMAEMKYKILKRVP